MKITDIETLPVGRWLFVRVHTDAGITGLGESGTWGYLEASEQVIKTFKRYLLGEDPLRIEHHWNYLYRCSHFRGAAIMGALSAIDIALWDIAGKHFDAPAYQLLGGKCRDRVRVYAHVRGDTTEKLVDRCEQAKQQGFTAVGHLSPFLDEPRTDPYFETYAGKISDAIDRVRRFREAVGDEVDLCIEIHRRLNPEEAVTLAGEIEPYRPLFYEDPIRPDNLDTMASVAEKVSIPIATGERLHTVHEFKMLLERDAVQYIRPDICLAGGLSHMKKIAALAESHYAGVVPHNPLGPVSTAASLQLAACIPNFELLEDSFRPDRKHARGADLIRQEITSEDGFLRVPERPGIGVELDDDILDEHPYQPRKFVTRLHDDGSVVDQ